MSRPSPLRSIALLAALGVVASMASSSSHGSPAIRLGDGTWTVGSDVPAGVYQVIGDVPVGCHWWVRELAVSELAPGAGMREHLIMTGGAWTGTGLPTVRLTAGQVFQVGNCGTWARLP